MRRVYEHKHKLMEGFTKKYNVSMLVFYESTGDVQSAIEREKQIKGWVRAKKIALIESMNPQWRDLSEGWDAPPQTLRCAQGDRSRREPGGLLGGGASGAHRGSWEQEALL